VLGDEIHKTTVITSFTPSRHAPGHAARFQVGTQGINLNRPWPPGFLPRRSPPLVSRINGILDQQYGAEPLVAMRRQLSSEFRSVADLLTICSMFVSLRS
jgi:hypothetical protein